MQKESQFIRKHAMVPEGYMVVDIIQFTEDTEVGVVGVVVTDLATVSLVGIMVITVILPLIMFIPEAILQCLLHLQEI
jgi:hypothetical protein